MKNYEVTTVGDDGTDTKETVKLRREINLLHATAVMTGVMIGSGIFVSPISIITHCGSVGLSLIVWALSGALALCVVLCYTELACLFPEAGGEYIFFLKSLGRLPAFLSTWLQFWTIIPCFMAILALTTVDYVIYPILPGCASVPMGKTILSVLVLFFVAYINSLYIRYVIRIQTIFMWLKLLALVLIIVGGLVYAVRGRVDPSVFSFDNTNTNPGPIGMALFGGIFTYRGWNFVFNLLEEVKNPEKIVPRAVFVSMASVTGLYLLTNVAYFAVMSPADMMSSDAVAVTLAVRVYGPAGAVIMPILVATSTLGALNGVMLGDSRKYFAAARDGLFPSLLATLHMKYNTPWISIFCTASITVVYIVIGDAVMLIEYLGFVAVLVDVMACLCVIYLRYTREKLDRPFKVPLPLASVAVVILIGACFLALYEKPYRNGLGVMLLLSGVPAYCVGVLWTKPAWYHRAIGKFNLAIQKILLVVEEDASTKKL